MTYGLSVFLYCNVDCWLDGKWTNITEKTEERRGESVPTINHAHEFIALFFVLCLTKYYVPHVLLGFQIGIHDIHIIVLLSVKGDNEIIS